MDSIHFRTSSEELKKYKEFCETKEITLSWLIRELLLFIIDNEDSMRDFFVIKKICENKNINIMDILKKIY